MVRTKKVHDSTLAIGIRKELTGKAGQAAHKRGKSLSEAIRQFLRDLAKQADQYVKGGQYANEIS